MRRQRFLFVWLVLAWPVLLGGCGGGKCKISGEVTMDDQPLETGFIAFVAMDGQEAPLTVAIQKGRYELRTTPGSKRVQISAPVVVGKRPEHNGPNAPMVEITQERLPPRYNLNTELTFEAKPGSHTKNWSVQSEKRPPRR